MQGGRLGGRPEEGIEARHLLSGFVLCGACGGSMHAIRRTSKRGAPRIYYVCNGWRVNGTCGNSWSLPLPDLDAAVLAALEEDVLMPDLGDDVVARAVALHAEQRAGRQDSAGPSKPSSGASTGRLSHYAGAIAAEGPLPSLLEAIWGWERRRADVSAQLEHLDGLSRGSEPTVTKALRATLWARLTSWSALLRRNPAEARPILRQLLVGRLTLTPRQLPVGRFYEFTGTASYGELLRGVVAGLVPPG